jgi:hypothetical protein
VGVGVGGKREEEGDKRPTPLREEERKRGVRVCMGARILSIFLLSFPSLILYIYPYMGYEYIDM